MNSVQLIYIAAGILLPLFYVPQIRRCLHDQSKLTSYSMSKSCTQLLLRLLMMPFVMGVGEITMTCIVCLDLVGRVCEYGCAVYSLRHQGLSWRLIQQRSFQDKGQQAANLPTNESIYLQTSSK